MVEGRGRNELAREFNILSGTGLALGADNVLSIHVDPTRPLMHLHLNGKGLEFLLGRVSLDMNAGATAPHGGAVLDPA